MKRGRSVYVTATLIAIVFPTETRANDVFRALNAMRRREVYNLDETLLAARSRTGVVTITAPGKESHARHEHPIEAITKLILAQTADNKVDGVELQNATIDPHFVTAVASKMNDEFSAIFFLIRAQSVGVAAELGNILSLFRGHIARTTLAP